MNEEFRKRPEKILEKLINIVEKTNPEILGVGSWTYSMPFVAEFTREFKARNPDIPIILGGSNATHVPTETLELLPHIDFCVRGEGEYTLLELCQTLSSGKNTFGNIKGISYRNKERKIVHTEDRPLIKNLDELPLLDLENFYKLPKTFRLAFNTSRGCNMNCTFCSIRSSQGHLRYYSIPYVIKNINHLMNLYESHIVKNTGIHFHDANLFFDLKRSQALLKLLRTNFHELMWSADTRIDSITEALATEIKKSNFVEISLGIESIIPETLIFFNKTNNPYKYISSISKVLTIFENKGIALCLNFIDGAPNETQKDMQKLKKFVIKCMQKPNVDRIAIGVLMVFPGTNLWYKYVNGDLRLFEVPGGSQEPFAEKYYNFVFMVPSHYKIRNCHMTNKKYLKLTEDIYEQCCKKIIH